MINKKTITLKTKRDLMPDKIGKPGWKQKQGKKNRAAGARFELKVRKDLESKGWIVDKWSNTVEFMCKHKEKCCARVIPAKRKYNPYSKVMAIGTGFPDFVVFKQCPKEVITKTVKGKEIISEIDLEIPFYVRGVEVKSNGYLTKEEKEKCRWLLDNNTFSKILIAKKAKQRGKIEYIDFEQKKQ